MTVTSIESRTVKTYTVDVEDGEVRLQPYSRVGARYRVKRVVVTKADGNISSVALHGTALKKDGTDGLNRADEYLYGEPPAWVTQILKGLA